MFFRHPSRITFYFNTAKRALAIACGVGKRVKRSRALVKAAYDENYARKTNEAFLYRVEPVCYHGALNWFPVGEFKRFLLSRFAEKINAEGGGLILELGSGRGLNLLSLAVLCPEVSELAGVELSGAGVAVARQNAASPPFHLLRFLTGLPEPEIRKRLRGKTFTFVEGTILSLPFAAHSFDVVFSNSVIEQLPRDYPTAFAEAYRVSRRLGIFSEPFKEAQRGNFFKRLYLKNIDYFRASFQEVEGLGWRIVGFEIPPIQKWYFNTGLLTVRKELSA